MPRVLFAVLCDDVRQEVAGKSSLMGIFGQFHVTDFKNPLPSFHIYAKIEFEQAGNFPIGVEFRSVEGQRIFQLTGSVAVEERTQGRIVGILDLKLENLRLPRHGDYEVVIVYNNQPLSILPIEVVVPPQRYLQ